MSDVECNVRILIGGISLYVFIMVIAMLKQNYAVKVNGTLIDYTINREYDERTNNYQYIVDEIYKITNSTNYCTINNYFQSSGSANNYLYHLSLHSNHSIWMNQEYHYTCYNNYEEPFPLGIIMLFLLITFLLSVILPQIFAVMILERERNRYYIVLPRYINEKESFAKTQIQPTYGSLNSKV